MSLGLTKPGMRSADLTGNIHPKTGLAIEPLYVRADGSAVWPVLGAAPDDPDDPEFTGDDDDDDDSDDEDEDDDPKDKGKRKSVKKSKSDDDDDDDEDDEDDEEDEKPTRPERQAARYRVQLRAAQKANRELAERLKALEDKDKPADEIAKREAEEAKAKSEKLAAKQRALTIENAVLKASRSAGPASRVIEWADVEDMMAVAEREGLWDDVVDDDGTVDSKALRLALRDLAKRKPHLVKSKAEPENQDDDEDDDDEEPRSRRTAPRMNGRRRGSRTDTNRAALAKKFPVLGGQ